MCKTALLFLHASNECGTLISVSYVLYGLYRKILHTKILFRNANITSLKNLMWHTDDHTQTPQLSSTWQVTDTITSHGVCYKDDQFWSLPSRIMVYQGLSYINISNNNSYSVHKQRVAMAWQRIILLQMIQKSFLKYMGFDLGLNG